MNQQKIESASFRDPSGFLFRQGERLFRQVNLAYKEDFELLVSSGLYDELVAEGLLVAHKEAEIAPPRPELAYKVIEPEQVGFISYPYEWSFSQFQDAALATLGIQKKALARGMTLKDATAYNIQFHRGRPVLIDTLSFEKLAPGKPWIAYGQFCRHFLAPLALMSRKDVRLGLLSRLFIDGVPLDLASKLLPRSSRLNFALQLHVHLHARMQARHAESSLKERKTRQVGARGLMGLIDSLESAVRKMKWEPKGTEWAEYYDGTNYSETAFARKREIVDRYLERVRPGNVWDLGANLGVFSRLAAGRGIPAVSFDYDPAAVEKNYRRCRAGGEKLILPLLLDLTNPSPSLGWAGEERVSLAGRGPADLVMALALVHHLAISNNLPLGRIAAFFRRTCRHLIVEFVPKNDSQVQRLLSSREDIFPDYRPDAFEEEFGKLFETVDSQKVEGSERTLYLMRAR